VDGVMPSAARTMFSDFRSLLASGPPGTPATSPPAPAGTASQVRNEEPGASS
jgi:hypothetical protein